MSLHRKSVEKELEQISRSLVFGKSPQLFRFLRFAVEQTLDGGPAKESVIGVEVFGRAPDYDPGIDPVVRVEARRLRRKLAEYYSHEGCEDPLEITLPTGGYSPEFKTRDALKQHVQSKALAVLPFVDRSETGELQSLSDGLTVRLITRLATCNGLKVVSCTSVFQFKNHSQDARRIGEVLNANLILEGSVRHDGKQIRCDSQLVSARDGLHLWAGSFDTDRKSPFAVEDEFVERIAEGVRSAFLQ